MPLEVSDHSDPCTQASPQRSIITTGGDHRWWNKKYRIHSRRTDFLWMQDIDSVQI